VSLLRRGTALLGALVVVVALAGCGGTADTDGAGEVTSLGAQPTVTRTITSGQIDAVLAAGRTDLRLAIKAFRNCDRKVSGDRFTAYACLQKVQAETAIVTGLVAQLAGLPVPPKSAAAVNDLKRLAAAGRLVTNKCAKAADQVCDQALARFRAHEQSLVWDLGLTV